jgi:hypothetical protein
LLGALIDYTPLIENVVVFVAESLHKQATAALLILIAFLGPPCDYS